MRTVQEDAVIRPFRKGSRAAPVLDMFRALKSRMCRVDPCTVCKGWHNYFLHDFTKIDESTTDDEVKTFARSGLRKETMFSTTSVAVLDKCSMTYEARVLLDSASQACLMTEALCTE